MTRDRDPEDFPEIVRAEDAVPGRIGAVYADRCMVWSAGDEVICSLRGRFKGRIKPVVGDHVHMVRNPDDSGTVTELLPRDRDLVRRQADRKRQTRAARGQVLAANVDLLVAVASIQRPPLRPGLLDRFLAAAAQAEIPVLICITKLDLDQDGEFEAVRDLYTTVGYPVLGLEMARPETLLPLREALRGKTAILTGHSGVGKTTLLNALAGREMATGTVGFHKDRGRHTTSTARLIPLTGEEGVDAEPFAFVIDSPGIREFALHGILPGELAPLFLDFVDSLTGCRFDDCLHRGEPGCALTSALEQGHIRAERYSGYLKLVEELMEG